MRIPRLVEYYQQLPPPQENDDLEEWASSSREALEQFGRHVQDQYTEATLGRLLTSHDPVCRRAAVVALGLVGTMAVNGAVAALLQDRDRLVRYLASDAVRFCCGASSGPVAVRRGEVDEDSGSQPSR